MPRRADAAKIPHFGALLLGLALAACVSEGDGAIASLEELPSVELVEELRTGSLDDPDRGFTRIGERVEVTEGDTVYVPERSEMEIRVYAPDGRLVRRIGRQGEGPGELRSVFRWGILGDTVWVLERDRATLFRRDGSLVSTTRLEPIRLTFPPYGVTIVAHELRADGTMRSRMSSYGPIDGDSPRVEARIPTLIFDPEGAVIDTVGFRTLTIDPGATPSERVGAVPIFQTSYPSSTRLQEVLGGDTVRILRAVPDDPDAAVMTVLRLGAGGDTLVRREHRYRPVPVPPTFRDSVLEARAETYARVAGDRAALRAAMEEMFSFASFYPPVSELTVAQDGSIWLLRAPGSDDAWQWVVLESDGEPQGVVTTPPNASIVWSGGDRVYVVERDEFDVPWLVRYRMEG